MESQNIEYKQSWKDEYLKWICGFANAQGGTIYIGIDDNGNVVGIDNAKYLLENLPNKCIQATGIVPDIELYSDAGKDYVAIHIKPSEQPVACNGKYYMRSGSTLQELSGNSLTDFLLRKTNSSWDMHIVPDATLDDIDADALRFFIGAAVESHRLDESARNATPKEILRKLGLLDKQGGLTFAALMLFGKDVEYYCPKAAFRIGRFGASQADLFFDDNIVCPLILMPDKVIQVLRSRYLVAPVKYEGLRRIEPLEIPEDALREIVCNAIVHRDYRGTFTQMRVWNDRIEVWNSGEFPPEITAENLMASHESHPRNDLIAKVFYLAGFIESWGRGYEKIRDAFLKEELTVPTFEQVRGGVMATIRRERFVNINIANDGENGGNLAVIELTEKQQKIIEIIIQNPTITANQMAVIMAGKKRTIERELSSLRQKGIISREGGARNGRWRVNN
ncbi:MAG: putative DNA binding domain-containing protein [Bacteroidales bacterium]|nr:putative DNA binding domain-containing protein [Bacteroidales bacterium]